MKADKHDESTQTIRRARPLISALALLVSSALFLPTTTVAQDDAEGDNEGWSDWVAGAEGFVARRKEPAKMDLSPSERKLARVEVRLELLEQKRADLEAKIERREQVGKPTEKLSERLAKVQTRIDQKTSRLAQRVNNGKPNALWLHTQQAGAYRLAVPTLADQMGISLKQLRKRATQGRLALTNDGEGVPWHFDPDSDELLFVGSPYETFYSDENAYWFSTGGKKHQRQMNVNAEDSALLAATDLESGAFTETLVFEEEPDMLYALWSVASEPDADYWFWDYLYGPFKNTIEVELDIPDPLAYGDAQLRITLRGWTDIVAGADHEVYAELNGQPIGSSVLWDGFEAVDLVIDFDQYLLNASGQNALVLRNRFAPGTAPGQWLDKIEIDYQRLPIADHDQLWLHAPPPGVQTVEGLGSADVVVIESPGDSNAVIHTSPQVEALGNDEYRVLFESRGDTDYLVVGATRKHTPRITVDIPSSLRKRDNAADYLIIAPRALEQTAQALSDYRNYTYGQVQTVFLEDIYDEFSAGREDPFALAQFMKIVNRRWSMVPTAVVLIGKGSLDQKDRMGYSDGFVPVVMTSTPWSLASSDDRLLGVTDTAPFVIGRIPITNNNEGLAYVDKLMTYESQDWAFTKSAVLVADNPDKAGDFHANSDFLAESLLTKYGFDTVDKLYHPDQPVRSILTSSETWNTNYVGYDGHGSTSQVGNGSENFITAADAALLSNTDYPIFAALTCAAGDDTSPGTRSLAGALVLNSSGGAIASFAPTGLSVDQDAQRLGHAFVDELLYSNRSVGESVQQAKYATSGYIREFMTRIYSVVGDPVVQAR